METYWNWIHGHGDPAKQAGQIKDTLVECPIAPKSWLYCATK